MTITKQMDVIYTGKFTKGIVAFNSIAGLQNIICGWKNDEMKLEIRGPERYGKTFIFLMGCLIILGYEYKKTVSLWLPPRIMRHFQRMNIVNYYKTTNEKFKSQTFFQLNKQSDVYILVNNIVDNIPVDMTEKLKELLISKIGEMYNNAVDHSNATYIMGGRYFKSRKNGRNILCFSCYDTGIGIINSVKIFLEITDPKWDNYEMNRKILKWALKKGHSTKVNISRGLGLDLLLNFALINGGTIRICNENVLFEQDVLGNRRYYELEKRFKGTLFEMEILGDSHVLYCLKGE